MRLTKQDIILRIRDMLREDIARFWTDAELLDNVNEGQRVIAGLMQCVQNIVTLTTIAEKREVVIGGYRVRFVEYDGTALRQILPKSAGNIPLNGTSPQFFFQSGTNLCIEPIPDAAYSLTTYLASYPEDLVADTDTSLLPASYDLALVYYGVMKGYSKEGNQAAAGSMEALLMSELNFQQADKSTYLVEDMRSIAAVVIPEPRGNNR